MMGTPREDRPKELRYAVPREMPFNTDRRLFHGRPRPSLRRTGGNQRVKNFPLVIAQILSSMSHKLVDATTGAYGYFRSVADALGTRTRISI
jgi:hypothetical protein